MVKKICNPLKIDFKHGIVENKLQQIRNTKITTHPDLVNVWTLEINPKDSKHVLDLIRLKTQKQDPISMLHIKRIRKITNESGQASLQVVLGSIQLFSDEKKVLKFLEENNRPFKHTNLTSKLKIPIDIPSTKEIMLEWSDKYWPLVWRGNPNDQILNDYIFDMQFIENILQKIYERSQEQYKTNNENPIVTAFVNPSDPLNVIYSCDHRAEDGSSPLDHSILNGISSVSEQLKKQGINDNSKNHEEGYLCLNFDVYTTHEPCSMCSMALIHSRIKRCIFIKPMQLTGSLKPDSGDGYCMHQNKLLNSSYEVFQWVGKPFHLPEVSQSLCC